MNLDFLKKQVHRSGLDEWKGALVILVWFVVTRKRHDNVEISSYNVKATASKYADYGSQRGSIGQRFLALEDTLQYGVAAAVQPFKSCKLLHDKEAAHNGSLSILF